MSVARLNGPAKMTGEPLAGLPCCATGHLPAVAVAADADPDADARCTDADARARTIIPIMIVAALDVSLARRVVIPIFHDDTAAAAGSIALAILVTNQANLLYKIRARVFTA
jgi:hypothetical protein